VERLPYKLELCPSETSSLIENEKSHAFPASSERPFALAKGSADYKKVLA